MAKFTSRFPELGFYVGGEFRRFHMGEFTTEDKAEIEVLEKLTDALRVDAPKAEEAPKLVKKAPAKASGYFLSAPLLRFIAELRYVKGRSAETERPCSGGLLLHAITMTEPHFIAK